MVPRKCDKLRSEFTHYLPYKWTLVPPLLQYYLPKNKNKFVTVPRI